MTAIETIRTITKSWTKPGTTEERLYLDRAAACQFIGLMVERYKSGSVKRAVLNGEKISNSAANRIIDSMAKAYYDVTAGEWVAPFGDYAIDMIADKLEDMEAAESPRGNELARRAMVRAHQIRREAAARFGCRISAICWSQCLVMAWAEVRG